MINQEIAVLMAAGLGSRMRPLTEKTPKPLVTIHGVPLIETMIDGLRKRKISKIFIVVGYKKEQFCYLADKYEEVVLVENKEYLEKNNISSIYAVCDYLGESNCFICESDVYVNNPDIFLAELTGSCYYGKMINGYSDDWIFETENNRIVRIKKGGTDVYNMTGVTYLLKEDAGLLKKRIKDIYRIPGTEKLFWDEVVDQLLPQLKMTINEIDQKDLVEIDTLQELVALDNSYQDWIKV